MRQRILTTALLAALAVPEQYDPSEEVLNAKLEDLRANRDGVSLAASFAPVMAGEYGTDQLEDITDALVVAGEVYQEAMADGKVTMFDAFNLPKLIEPLNAVNEGKELTGKQATDLYDVEATALIESTVTKAKRFNNDPEFLSIVKQISRVTFASLTLASIIRRRNAASA